MMTLTIYTHDLTKNPLFVGLLSLYGSTEVIHMNQEQGPPSQLEIGAGFDIS